MTTRQTDVRSWTAPFSTADLFLYLIPGATLIVAVLFFEGRIHRAADAERSAALFHLPTLHALAQAAEQSGKIDRFVFAALFYTVLIVVAYVVGHVVSSVSSFALDRILSSRGHGYPYRYILGLRRSGDPLTYSEAFYRGTFVWLNVALVGLYAHFGWSVKWRFAALAVLPFLVGSTAKIVLDARPEWRRRTKDLVDLPPKAKSLFWYYSRPYDVAAGAFAHLTNSRQPLPQPLLRRFGQRFKRIFGCSYRGLESDNFWMVYCDVMTHSGDVPVAVEI